MVCLPRIQFVAKRFDWKMVGVSTTEVSHLVLIAFCMPSSKVSCFVISEVMLATWALFGNFTVIALSLAISSFAFCI